MPQLHQQIVSTEGLLEDLPSDFRKCPGFLGNFGFRIYGNAYGKSFGKLPRSLGMLARQMGALHPEQQFTTAFLQRYDTGHEVLLHRDPRNNVGHTVITTFGDYDGAVTTLYTEEGKQILTLRPGDVFSLECTIGGKQGLPHEVSRVTRGTRFALILNTII